jgi:hypothetical protein
MLGQEPELVVAEAAAPAEIVPVILPHQTELPIVAAGVAVAGSLIILAEQAAPES